MRCIVGEELPLLKKPMLVCGRPEGELTLGSGAAAVEGRACCCSWDGWGLGDERVAGSDADSDTLPSPDVCERDTAGDSAITSSTNNS